MSLVCNANGGQVEFRRRARALGADMDVDQLVMIDDLAGMSMKGMGDVMKFMPTMKVRYVKPAQPVVQ